MALLRVQPCPEVQGDSVEDEKLHEEGVRVPNIP